MPLDPWRPFNPDGGDHYLLFERRFRYLVEDPEHTWRRVWTPTVIACPICGIDTGLRLAFKTGTDAVVEAACPTGHVWGEPRVDVSQWMAYCRFRAGQQEIDWLWLIQAGFGEEPPPPIDYVAELRKSSVEIAKYAKRKAKTKVRREVRKARKKVGKRVRNEAMRPVAAILRTAWTMQAGGVEPVDKRRRRAEPKAPKTPPVSTYRKAYGMEAPKKGPKCLVCEDSGRITAPGISIPCTECAGPAAAALAAAERRAERARQGKDRRRTRTENRGAITRSGEQADGPAQAATGRGPGADKAQHAAAEAIARSIRAPGARAHTGVTNFPSGNQAQRHDGRP
ncbi:hypothetical protein ACFW2D_17960 [Streptomyces sp. NPDC058914]|uniref:hypothetical protein n=1 Tax=Streptomyces sp. NPDC058914 TaxID=3346671 RepID=UPI0036B05471